MEKEINKIPQNLINLMSSPELFAAIEKIQNTLGLHIDQSGELYVIVCEIITGSAKSSDFMKNVDNRLNVKGELAKKIAEMTNREIFDVIKNKLQSDASAAETASTISNIEHVGGFHIEKAPPVADTSKITPAGREAMLEHLEDPSGNQGGTSVSSTPDNHSEPLIDHLLQNPIGFGEQKQHVAPHVPDNLPAIEEGPAQTPKIPSPTPIKAPEAPKPPQRQGPDPYRETVK